MFHQLVKICEGTMCWCVYNGGTASSISTFLLILAWCPVVPEEQGWTCGDSRLLRGPVTVLIVTGCPTLNLRTLPHTTPFSCNNVPALHTSVKLGKWRLLKLQGFTFVEEGWKPPWTLWYWVGGRGGGRGGEDSNRMATSRPELMETERLSAPWERLSHTNRHSKG